MAKTISPEVIERIHLELESDTPCCTLPDGSYSYYDAVGPDHWIHGRLEGREFWDAKATFELLVLAAEDELDGYPMEATS